MRPAVVTIQRGRHEHLRRQAAAVAASPRRPVAHVVVSMDDEPPEVPGADVVHLAVAAGQPLPLARARNTGFEHAVRVHRANQLIALDVDCLPSPSLIASYSRALARQPKWLLAGAVRYLPPGIPAAGALPSAAELLRAPHHPARPVPADDEILPEHRYELFWSLSFAITPRVHQALGGFDERYEGYGAEDTDYAVRARQCATPFGWVGDAEAYHQHHAVSSPPVEHLADIVRNARRFHAMWNSWPMPAWLAEFERRGLVDWDREAGTLSLRPMPRNRAA